MGNCRMCLKSCENNSLFKNRFFREKFQDVICMWVDPNSESGVTDVCKECETDVVEFYSFKHQCRDILHGLADPTPLIEDHGKAIPPKPEAKQNPETLQSLLDNCAETVELSIEILEEFNKDETETPAATPKKEPRSNKRSKVLAPPDKKRRMYTFKTPEERLAEKLRPKRPIRRKTEAEKAMDPAEYKRYYFQKALERYKRTCEVCGKRMQPDRLEGHMNGHKGLTPFPCEHCDLQFNCKLNLRAHIIRMHTTGNEVNCTQCGKEFSNASKMRQHIFSVHTEKRFQCTICGLKILNNTALRRHMDIHNQKRDHICPHCGKAFYCKSVLTIHLRTHSGETPYVCNICPKGFIHRRIYVMHMQKFHPDEPMMYLSGAKSMKETLMKKY